MKVLSGIDRVFFSYVDSSSFEENFGSVGFITENEGEYTREVKTIKLANGQDLTTCTEYKFKFETADSAQFGFIRSTIISGEFSIVAVSNTGGCLAWLHPANIFIKEVLDQKSGDLKKLQVTVMTTGDNLLPINYGNNLFPPYIANSEDISLTTVTDCTKSNPTKNVSFTAGVGKVIQLVSTTGSDGYLDFTFNFPAEFGMGVYTASVDNWSNGTIEMTVYDFDQLSLGTDSESASESNVTLTASIDLSDQSYVDASYIKVRLGVATGTTAQFDNLKLAYGITPVMD